MTATHHLYERPPTRASKTPPHRANDGGAHEIVLPFSCVTGAAKLVEEKLIGFPMSARCRWFLGLLLLKTFGDAGYHRKLGEEESSCTFSLRAWSYALQQRVPTIQPKHVLYLRDQLVAHRIIWYEPGDPGSGTGRIGWNLDLDAWIPFGHGGARAGAGNPYLGTPAFTAYLHSLREMQSEGEPPDIIQDRYALLLSDDNDVAFQVGNTPQSSWECPPASAAFKLGMPDPLEMAPEAPSSAPLIKVTEKKTTSADAHASDGAAAAVAPRPILSKKKALKGTTKTPPERQKPRDPAWDAVRQEGFRLLSATYGAHGYHHGVEAGALLHLFRQYHVRSPDELRAVWEATLLDPYWRQERQLSMTLLAQKISIYRQNPSSYRLTMLQKREQHDRRYAHDSGPHPPSRSAPRGGRAPGRVNRSAADRHAALEAALRGGRP
jgi:hypothetical protein